MDIEVIRKKLNERPFKAIVFHLDNGEKQVIRHPEIIVTDVMVMAADDDGLPVLIKPEAITAIHYARNLKPRLARRRKRAASRR
jgi:hypothetical protein